MVSKFYNRRKDGFLEKIREDVCYMKLTGLLDAYLDHIEGEDANMTFEEFEQLNSNTYDKGETT